MAPSAADEGKSSTENLRHLPEGASGRTRHLYSEPPGRVAFEAAELRRAVRGGFLAHLA